MAASRWSDKGFSLVELMVALAIFAASFGVLLSAHTSAARQEAHARHLFTATSLARQVLTWTELEEPLELGEETGDFGDEFPLYTWKRTVTDADLTSMVANAMAALGLQGIPIPAGLGGVMQVDIEVLWSEREKAQEASITYFAVVQ